ncbi:MAG TPA: molybdopterin converting factor subunit 1 [Rhizomicrobium sp.]|jgi:molybdopterin synthase sulfur carrier subunit|nr:molybdopterin converting factor subunit 1 [Rhizomicrobium sp.]
MKILYFAWLRQKIGKSEEDISLPPQISTVADLVSHLSGRGGGYAEAFDNPGRIRAALNQEHVRFDAKLAESDEVAFFPPVTGG